MPLTAAQATFLLRPPPFRGRVVVLSKTIGANTHYVALHGEQHRFSTAHHIKRQILFHSPTFPTLALEQADPTAGFFGGMLHRLVARQPFKRMPWCEYTEGKTVYALEDGLRADLYHHLSEPLRGAALLGFCMHIGSYVLPDIPQPPTWWAISAGIALALHALNHLIPQHICRLPRPLHFLANPINGDAIGRERQQAFNINRVIEEDRPAMLSALVGAMHVPGTTRHLLMDYDFEVVERSALLAFSEPLVADAAE